MRTTATTAWMRLIEFVAAPLLEALRSPTDVTCPALRWSVRDHAGFPRSGTLFPLEHIDDDP